MGRLPADWALPALDDWNTAWFTSGQLMLQQCADCGDIQHPPEEICRRCGSMTFAHTPVAARGKVYSYTVAHYAVHPALAGSVPYTVLLVSLDEAPQVRVVGNLADDDGAVHAYIGMPVEAFWEERQAGDEVVRLAQWRSLPGPHE